MKRFVIISCLFLCTYTGFSLQNMLGQSPVSVQSYQQAGAIKKAPTPFVKKEALIKLSKQIKKDRHTALLGMTTLFLKKQQSLMQAQAQIANASAINTKAVLTLQTKLGVMESQINTLTTVLRTLNKHLGQVQKTQHHLNQGIINLWFGAWENFLGNSAGNIVATGIILLIIFLLLWMILGNKHTAATPKKQKKKHNIELGDDEYDFMGSKEGMSAKLDLARAYLAMEDFHAAETVLNEVKEQGNTKQKATAEELLKECQ